MEFGKLMLWLLVSLVSVFTLAVPIRAEIYGIHDVAPYGSYWLNTSGYSPSSDVPWNMFNLKSDFIQVDQGWTMAGNGTLREFRILDSNSIVRYYVNYHPCAQPWMQPRLDEDYFGNIYNGDNKASPKIYFFDWESSSWKIWMKGTNNATHGMPNFADNRFKQAFGWKYRFERSDYPIIEFQFLMTAHDPYLRIFIELWSYKSRVNHTLLLPIFIDEKTYYLDYNTINKNWSKIRPGYTPIGDTLAKNFFVFFDKPNDKINFIAFNQKFGKGNDKSLVVWDDTNNNGKPDKITFILNFDKEQPQNFLALALGYIPNEINTESGNPSTWKLEDGRTIEQIAEDSLTYYEINSWDYHNLTNKVSLTWNEIPNGYGISGRRIFGAYDINTSNCNQIGKMGYYTTLDCRDINPIIFTQKQQMPSPPSWAKGYVPNQTQWEKLILNKSVQTQKGNITIQIMLNKSEIRSVIAGIPGIVSNPIEKSEVSNLTGKEEKEGTGFFDRILDRISKAVYRIMSIFLNKKG